MLTDLGDALDDYASIRCCATTSACCAIWEVGGDRNALQLVGLKLEYCRTELARGADAEWTAARLKRACSCARHGGRAPGGGQIRVTA